MKAYVLLRHSVTMRKLVQLPVRLLRLFFEYSSYNFKTSLAKPLLVINRLSIAIVSPIHGIRAAAPKFKSSSRKQRSNEVTTSAESVVSKSSNMRWGIGQGMRKYICSVIIIPRTIPSWSVLGKHILLFEEVCLHSANISWEIST